LVSIKNRTTLDASHTLRRRSRAGGPLLAQAAVVVLHDVVGFGGRIIEGLDGVFGTDHRLLDSGGDDLSHVPHGAE
jgi:hypothetical protein